MKCVFPHALRHVVLLRGHGMTSAFQMAPFKKVP